MPKHETKVGVVSLKLEKDGKWRVRWWDARLKKYFRRVLPATSYSEATAMAKIYNREISAEKGFGPSMRTKAGHGVNAALAETIETADARPKTKRDYASMANLFMRWLSEKRPGVTAWSQVNAKLLQDYLRHCQGLGLSFDTVRLRFHIVRSTSLHMSETYPGKFSHVARTVKMKRQKAIEKPTLLTAVELMDFLSFAADARPDLHGIVALQSLAGLRVLEASHLREGDVDFAAGTVSIVETSRHAPKTMSSHRTIPICAVAMDTLRASLERLSIRHGEGYIFMTRRQEPWSADGIGHALGRLVRDAWRATGHESLRGFVPKNFRKVFVNLAREMRADERTLKAYVGHSQGDVLGENYEQFGIERCRVEIVSRIEAQIQKAEAALSGANIVERMASDLH